jgi:ketosteroid isomerase-like protein
VGEAADVVRRATDRLNEGDVDGFIELCSKRIRFQDVPEIPGSGLYQGPDEVRRWAEGILETAEDLRFTFWEKEERGDAVMFETSVDVTGASSGAQVGWRFWTVWRVKDDRITYHHGYSELEPARADLEGE